MRRAAVLAVGVLVVAAVAGALVHRAHRSPDTVDHRAEYGPGLLAEISDRCESAGVGDSQFCGCMTEEATTRLTPAEYREVMRKMSGAAGFGDLRPELARAVQDMQDGVRRDCG